MDRYLLKNIIILILVLVNGFLLGSLAIRETAVSDARQQTESQIIALFSADGMTLDEGAFSRKTPPEPLTLTRDIDLERRVARFFLGSGLVQSDQGGGTYTYTSQTGVARFRANGSFDIVGALAPEDPQGVCRKFCQTFSFGAPQFSLDDTITGSGSATALYNDLPVFNCSVTFTVDHGSLLTVSGTLLSGEGSALGEPRKRLSSSAALTAFQQMRHESGAVVSAVLDTYLCYEMQSTAALSLTPAWCIVTDTTNYYVNCITGEVLSH